jgi:hypothetical protein
MSIKGSEEKENLKLKKHNNYQGSSRNLCHAWRDKSTINLCEVLAIIHDGVDTDKQLFFYVGGNKSHCETIPSTCKPHMHGHGDDAYAH